jgi:hypothetical protein
MQQLIFRCFLNTKSNLQSQGVVNPKNQDLNRTLPAALVRFFNLTFNYAQ